MTRGGRGCREEEGVGAHVKPSTATTGSRMMSMVKYLHKRRVKRLMTGEQQAANGAAGGSRGVTGRSCHRAPGPGETRMQRGQHRRLQQDTRQCRHGVREAGAA